MQHSQRAGSNHWILFMNPNHFLMKCNHLLILMSPGICPPVIRIRKSTDAGFISIIYGRRTNPGHLNSNCLPHNCRVDSFTRSLGSQFPHASYNMVRPRQETRMIVVRQFIHRRLNWRCHHTCHMMIHRTHKIICISPQIFPPLIAVFLHTGQKPGERFHKCVIIHHTVPLVSHQPFRWISIVFSQNQRIRPHTFNCFPKFFPE